MRERGLEPLRCYPLAPQASASTNSATRAVFSEVQLGTSWRAGLSSAVPSTVKAAVIKRSVSYESSPPPPLSRATLVIGLYAAMGIVALLIAAGRGDPDLYRLGGNPSATLLLAGPALGAAIGLVFVSLTRVATTRLQWARDLQTSFHDLLGPLTGREIGILAIASSIGEELLFRGALMPWFGVWISSAIFAALHIGPGRRFLPWTASAFVLGVMFAELAHYTGNLGGPICAHFAINFLNLRYIVRHS